MHRSTLVVLAGAAIVCAFAACSGDGGGNEADASVDAEAGPSSDDLFAPCLASSNVFHASIEGPAMAFPIGDFTLTNDNATFAASYLDPDLPSYTLYTWTTDPPGNTQVNLFDGYHLLGSGVYDSADFADADITIEFIVANWGCNVQDGIVTVRSMDLADAKDLADASLTFDFACNVGTDANGPVYDRVRGCLRYEKPPAVACPTGSQCMCTESGLSNCAPSTIGPTPCAYQVQFQYGTCTVCCTDACSTNADCPAGSHCRWGHGVQGSCIDDASSTDMACGDFTCSSSCPCTSTDGGLDGGDADASDAGVTQSCVCP